MDAQHTISGLLRDAEYVANANNLALLAFFIGIALRHAQQEMKKADKHAA